jgi:hypothetical protein
MEVFETRIPKSTNIRSTKNIKLGGLVSSSSSSKRGPYNLHPRP